MSAMFARSTRIVLGAVALSALSAQAASDIIRCVGAGGGVTYQQVACPDASTPQHTSIPTEYPPQNLVERERIFEREAALHRRLEARRDRDLQETQMREARAEREAERERHAAQLAAQTAQPQYLILYPMPVSRMYPRRTLGPGPSLRLQRPG